MGLAFESRHTGYGTLGTTLLAAVKRGDARRGDARRGDAPHGDARRGAALAGDEALTWHR
jgi:hypothetical protein